MLRSALAYTIPVLPTSLARWFLVVHGDVKPFATAAAQFGIKGIFTLSGVVDVVVFMLTRRKSGLLGFDHPESSNDILPMKGLHDTHLVSPISVSSSQTKFWKEEYTPLISPSLKRGKLDVKR